MAGLDNATRWACYLLRFPPFTSLKFCPRWRRRQRREPGAARPRRREPRPALQAHTHMAAACPRVQLPDLLPPGCASRAAASRRQFVRWRAGTNPACAFVIGAKRSFRGQKRKPVPRWTLIVLPQACAAIPIVKRLKVPTTASARVSTPYCAPCGGSFTSVLWSVQTVTVAVSACRVGPVSHSHYGPSTPLFDCSAMAQLERGA